MLKKEDGVHLGSAVTLANGILKCLFTSAAFAQASMSSVNLFLLNHH